MTCSGGKRTRMGPFLSSLFIAHSQEAPSPPSRLKLFRRLGFQLGLASLVGRRLGAGCSPLTTWRDLVGASPTGAFCVNMRKPQITFFCFARRPECYDFWSSPFLGCNGWFLCEKKPLGLAWIFCGQEKGESLESCPPLSDVDHLERKE